MRPIYDTDKIPGIYMFTNLNNCKRYIGHSNDMYQRWYGHRERTRNKNMVLHLALDKYGWDAFNWEVVERMVNATKQQLKEREQYWILHYRTNEKEYGYNRDLPLNCPYRKKRALDNLEKINSSNRKRAPRLPLDSYSRMLVSDSHRGAKWSKEEREAIAVRQMGKDNQFYGKHHKQESLDRANHSRFLRRFFNPKPHYMAVYIKAVSQIDASIKYFLIEMFAKQFHRDKRVIRKRIESGEPLDGCIITLASKEEILQICKRQRLTNMATICGTPTYW